MTAIMLLLFCTFVWLMASGAKDMARSSRQPAVKRKHKSKQVTHIHIENSFNGGDTYHGHSAPETTGVESGEPSEAEQAARDYLSGGHPRNTKRW